MQFPALPFASCFAYLPAGSGAVCEEGRLLCDRLKAADEVWLPRLVARIWLEAAGNERFACAFGSRVILIPVPGSSPAKRAHWVGARLAWCLREVGLAAEVWPVLRRRYAVSKSAVAAAGQRPSVMEHYESFAVECLARNEAPIARRGSLASPGRTELRLTLVDDVITRGRTLLAAAGRLREAFPTAQIGAFALLRTLNRDEVLHQVLDPCEGEVRWLSGDARRNP